MTNTKRYLNTMLLTASAICLALCMVLPFLTLHIPQIGNALCPMHIPVLLCGFVCGPAYAAVVGAVAPLLRFVLFGVPSLFPTGVAMCFELAAYGFLAGVLYRALPRKTPSVYAALIVAMLGGRVVWGIVMVFISGISPQVTFTWELYLGDAFVKAIPGIIVQIVLIPLVVLALERTVPWMKKA